MQNPSHKTSAKELFLDALDLEGSAREQFLAEHTGKQPELRAQVNELLHAHGEMKADSTIGHTSLGGISALPTTTEVFSDFLVELQPGQEVGPFTLEREIGRGGFGRVWLASQTEPVRRHVALKMLKAGLDTQEITTRFLAERQALALMDHPGIARIYDGGATESGSPWFAMEYVDGLPITNHCLDQSMSLNDRLRLFLQTCRAVQHAHQKSIVHRDIKPNNVLVTKVDGLAVPKVIDFGIAKAIEQSLTAEPLQTRGGQAMGTPAYMSPEQVVEAADVDTRADVYSLGVLLYEMLTGCQPFSDAKGELPTVNPLLHAVQHTDPPLPSSRLKAKTSASGVRQKDLRGDLDWITMRCLEKDRERRYDSVALLANDIERHVAGDTVLAGPPTLSYRLSKLTKRYRAALVVSFAIVALLTGGIIAAKRQANRAIRAEANAQEETRKAKVELERSESIAALLERVLMGIEPEAAKGMDLELLLSILNQAHEHVDSEEPSPEVEGTIRRVIGGAYLSIARYEESEVQLLRALNLREEVLGEENPQTLESMEELGGLYITWGKLEKGLPYLERCYQVRLTILGANHDDTMHALGTLAAAHLKLSQYDLAIKELRLLRTWNEVRFGPKDRKTLLVINNLALALGHIGADEEALDLLETLVVWQGEVHGLDGARTLMALGNLGSHYSKLERYSEAAAILERSLASKRRVFAPGHPSLLIALGNLARAYRKLDNESAAEDLLNEALEQGLKAHGPGQRHVQILQLNLADLCLGTERKPQARTLLEELLPRAEESEASNSPLLKAIHYRLNSAQE